MIELTYSQIHQLDIVPLCYFDVPLGEIDKRLKQKLLHMAQVGINRAVNAFIDVGKKSLARDLYEDAKNNGFQTSSYIEKRL